MSKIQNELELILKITQETTGEQFGITVPLLELELKNIGSRALAVPKEGDSLLFSLRLSLIREGRTIFHEPTRNQSFKLELDPLFPGKAQKILLSPLHNGLEEKLLDAGVYEARVWVASQSVLPFTSIFAAEFGDVCSNMVQLNVKSINPKGAKTKCNTGK